MPALTLSIHICIVFLPLVTIFSVFCWTGAAAVCCCCCFFSFASFPINNNFTLAGWWLLACLPDCLHSLHFLRFFPPFESIHTISTPFNATDIQCVNNVVRPSIKPSCTQMQWQPHDVCVYYNGKCKHRLIVMWDYIEDWLDILGLGAYVIGTVF